MTGLLGDGLVLQNNLGDDMPIAANGRFTFSTALAGGTSYVVTVKTQPTSPWQTCTVANYTGTIDSANVTDVAIACITNRYSLGGTVSGLAGSGLVLQDNAGDDLGVASDGTFAFPTAVASGSAYAVTVKAQPTSPSQTCSVANGAGTIVDGNVTNVAVTCATNTYPVGGTVSGLAGSGLVLQNNAADDLGVGSDGAFTFATPIASGSSYSVSVKTQPSSPRQTCTVTSGTGAVTSGAVTNVSVACINTYSLGGTISGLVFGGLVLASLGQPDLAIDAGATTFTFPTALPAGSVYAVTVKTQPTSQACTIQNASGVVGYADITSVAVSCVRLWSRIGAGDYYSAGITTNGVLWTWGENLTGQLGDGTAIDRYTPVQIGAEFSSVTLGNFHTAAVKTDGTLWGWGQNGGGEIGDGTTTLRRTPVQVGVGFASVVAGGDHTVGLKADGTLWAWGHNNYGQLGDGTTTDRYTPTQVGSAFTSIAAGGYHTAGVKTDGTLWTWGRNTYGQLGDGTTTSHLTPVQVGVGFTSVAAGTSHTVGVKADGTVWTWGRNANGQLGDGTTIDRLTPVQVGSGFSSIAACSFQTLALKTDGTLWGWGDNAGGELGDGTTTNRSAPVEVGSGFSAVAAGVYHTLALKTDGTLWVWGSNSSGALGDGTTTSRLTPVQIP